MVTHSSHRIRVTIDHNLMIFSRNTELITWHDIFSSLLTGGPYDSGFLCNQNKDLLTIRTMYLIFILWIILVHIVCILSNKHFSSSSSSSKVAKLDSASDIVFVNISLCILICQASTADIPRTIYLSLLTYVCHHVSSFPHTVLHVSLSEKYYKSWPNIDQRQTIEKHIPIVLYVSRIYSIFIYTITNVLHEFNAKCQSKT